MIHTLTIPNYAPPTLNSTMRNTLRDRMRHGRECRDMVKVYAIKQGVPRARSARRVRVTIIFPPNRRRPDPDALPKVLLDALKSAKLILDDTYELSTWEPPVYFVGERLETRIELEDVEPKVVGRIDA